MRLAKPCVIVSHSPNLAWRPSCGEASGCQLVPDDSRVGAYGPYQARIACDGVLAVIGVRGRCGRWSRVVVLMLALRERAPGEEEKCEEVSCDSSRHHR